MGTFGVEAKENGSCGGIEEIEHGRDVTNVDGLGKFRGLFESKSCLVTFCLVNEESQGNT